MLHQTPIGQMHASAATAHNFLIELYRLRRHSITKSWRAQQTLSSKRPTELPVSFKFKPILCCYAVACCTRLFVLQSSSRLGYVIWTISSSNHSLSTPQPQQRHTHTFTVHGSRAVGQQFASTNRVATPTPKPKFLDGCGNHFI